MVALVVAGFPCGCLVVAGSLVVTGCSCGCGLRVVVVVADFSNPGFESSNLWLRVTAVVVVAVLLT